MEENKIISTIKEYIAQYSQDVVQSENLLFNMKKTVNKIKLYINSKFISEGPADRIFYNITLPSVINSVKNTDIDTKDIKIRAKYPKDRLKAFIYNEKLREFMTDEGFGLFINNINRYYTTFGSVIIKNTKENDLRIVDLEDIIIDPSISNEPNSFEIKSSYIIEKMYVSPEDLIEMSTKGWENVEEVLEKFKTIKKTKPYFSEIEIYEAFCMLPDELFNNGNGVNLYRIYFTCDNNLALNKIFYYEQVDEFPYLKLDFEIVEKRALGKGIPENLFDTQKRVNEIKNQMRESMKISSVHLFQTPDELIEKNVLQDLSNGDILNTSGLTSVASEERNLPAWNTELQTWTDNGKAITNSFEILTGEDLPSNITLGGQILQTQQGAKYFKIKRQELGMFLEKILEEFILPKFEKELKPEEIIKITDIDTLSELIEKDVDARVTTAVINSMTEKGLLLTEQEIEAIREVEKEKATQEKDFFVKAYKDYFKFDKTLELDITGEKDNLATTINTKLQILNMPNLIQLLQDPMTKNAVESLFEDVGFKKNLLGKPQAGIQMTPQQMMPQKAPQQQVNSIAGAFQETAKPSVA